MAALSGFYSNVFAVAIDPTMHPQFQFTPFTADINGDGNQDLLQLGANYPGHGITDVPQQGRLFFGDGKGGFTLVPESVFPFSTLLTVQPARIFVADLNGDNRPDVFINLSGFDAAPGPGEQNRLYLSKPDGSWYDATATLPQLKDFSHSSSIGDINHDGDLDIFVGNGYSGQNKIFSYVLDNNGSGAFTLTRAGIPGSGSVIDFNFVNGSAHNFAGSTLTDLNGDGFPELLVNADAGVVDHQSAILWNHNGIFSESDMTLLPRPTAFTNHIDLDTKSIDINGDGLLDIVMLGTQQNPFYGGWFVQILQNQGGRNFVDVTSTYLAASDSRLSTAEVTSNDFRGYGKYLTVLDFNHDGFQDFAVEYNGSQINASTPMVWLNDGTGHFTTLKASDFIDAGGPNLLQFGHIYETLNGYSFLSPTYLPATATSGGGFGVGSLLAKKPYTATIPSNGNALLFGDTGNDALTGGSGADTLTGGLGSDTFRYLAATDSTAAATDVITDPGSTDKLDFIGMTGVNYYSGAYGYAASVAATVSTIQADPGIANKAVFFTDAADGYIYVKGAGTGVSFDGSLIKLAGMTSAPTLLQLSGVNTPATGGVTMAGVATEDQLLTAANTFADDNGLGAINYQWQSSSDGLVWSNIAGAVSVSLSPGDALVGMQVRATASFVDGHGTTETASSSASGAIANVNDTPGGTVTLSGTETQGQTLSASNTLADADGLGTISYQWKANGVNISGATTATLVLGQSQVAKTLSVTASYTDGHGTAESVASTATGAIADINDAPTAGLFGNRSAGLNQSLSLNPGALFHDLDGDALTFGVSGLPAGLSMNATGLITGVSPNAAGVHHITVTATDPGTTTATLSFDLNILVGNSVTASLFTRSAVALPGVSVHQINTPALGSLTDVVADVGSTGQWASTLPDGSLQLSFSRGVLDYLVNGITKPVTAADALDALKLSVGLAASKGSSWRELISADITHDGRVTAADALEILKTSVGINTIQPSWVFVPEGAGVNAGLGTMSKSTVTYSTDYSLASVTSVTSASITGILVGDVNNSWLIPA